AVCTLRFFASPICCHPFEDDSLNYPVVTVSKGGSTIVQSGPAKDLSFRIRQAWHRANADQAEGDQNEFRLIVDYPLSIL
ncbi:OprD family outer membrane porin, partial [Pseudomonas aeruginosa]|uniref:OprD family outer membrane porin n=1 Tax=Pseudomonas aeruginosa TaxID=287 RepID=UPI0039845798